MQKKDTQGKTKHRSENYKHQIFNRFSGDILRTTVRFTNRNKYELHINEYPLQDL